MKKYTSKILGVILMLTMLPVYIHAEEEDSKYLTTNFRIPNPSKYNSLEAIISAAGSLIQPVFIISFAAMVLYGAWIRETKGSETESLAKSNRIIFAAATGFILAVFAPSIVNLLADLLGVEGGLELI